MSQTRNSAGRRFSGAPSRARSVAGQTRQQRDRTREHVAQPRNLILLRHAKSSWDEPELPDFDRPLAPRGVRDGREFAPRLAAELPVPDRVLCSPARRTRDTAAFLFGQLVDPRCVTYPDALYQASEMQLLETIRGCDDARTLLVIGHNPGLTDLLNVLVAPGAPAIENLPTFGVATFRVVVPFAELDPGCARLTRLLRPRDEELC